MIKRIMTALCLCMALFGLPSCDAKKNGAAAYTSVPMAEGIRMMAADTDFVLLDVRRPDEYAAGRIPGAVLCTNEDMTKKDMLSRFSDTEQTLYVYCRSGRRSKEASGKLASWGYTDVVEIGGINSYAGPIER